ncbi:hypothetical protein ACFC1L_27035 [Streptomyces sp. NPDC056210]|uniref:hypothetical protein n=1 Tax=unclassified Streptomyces TaxID=2593676 RepID=UPI0035DB4ED4
MSTSPEKPALPLITVHAKAAASAQRRVSDLLETTGARPQEIQHLLAVIKAGALESTHVDVSALGAARLKSWRAFRKARCRPNRMSSIAAAVLTLERQC